MRYVSCKLLGTSLGHKPVAVAVMRLGLRSELCEIGQRLSSERLKEHFREPLSRQSDLRRFGGLCIELFTLAPGLFVQILSDQLNRYFIKTTERTMGSLSNKATDLVDLIDSPSEPDRYPFQLRTVSTEEVLKEISLLRPDCSTGIDQIPVKYVKQVGDFLTGPLAHIINVCSSNSQFPRIWKTARISPDPKVDNPKQNADYRPVSILPVLSKVSERLVLKQLVHSIDEQFLLLPSISGFRKGQSTTTVHHNWFARYSGRSYSGLEEG